jgi:hypothetical protein
VIRGLGITTPNSNKFFIIDRIEWTSFDVLRSKLEINFAKQKTADKYENAVSMYIDDELMQALGLVQVLQKVCEMALGVQVTVQIEPTSPIHKRVINVNTNIFAGSINNYDTLSTSLHRNYPENQNVFISSSALIDEEPELQSADIPNVKIIVRSIDNKNLKELFINGTIISFAVAGAENVDLQILDYYNDFEWIFESPDIQGIAELLVRGSIRVLGYDLVLSSHLPSI